MTRRAPSRPGPRAHTQEMTLICTARNTSSTESARREEAKRTLIYTRVLPSCAERDLDKAARESFCSRVCICAYQRISAAPDLERFSPEIYAADPGAAAAGENAEWPLPPRRRATITLCDAELILKGRPTQTKQTTR